MRRLVLEFIFEKLSKKVSKGLFWMAELGLLDCIAFVQHSKNLSAISFFCVVVLNDEVSLFHQARLHTTIKYNED